LRGFDTAKAGYGEIHRQPPERLLNQRNARIETKSM
jgi:hypothetical protein